MTPIHLSSFKNGQNGAVQPVASGQPAAQPMSAGINPPQQPDSIQGGFPMDSNADVSPRFHLRPEPVLNNGIQFDIGTFQFVNPVNGNADVLQDFDFDSFLHQDGEGVDNFSFDTSGFLEGEIGAD
jgi:hypothetical protein